MHRRHVTSWCLYDFGNSVYAAVIVATVWAAYFANEIVGNEQGAGDLWWGWAISISMFVVAATSPLTGALADAGGLRKKLLIAYTLLSVGGTALLARMEPGWVVAAFTVTVLANVGFEGAMVFYNAYLPELAPPDMRGRLSGWGYAAGYAGSALGLVAVLPLVRIGRYSATFLVVAGAFLLFALPALLWLPKDEAGRLPARTAVRQSLLLTQRTLREILRTPALRRFLLAYLFYEDGVNTIIYFSSIFAAHTLGFEMAELLGLFLIVQVSALAGSAAWAIPTDRWGPRRVLLVLIAQWCAVVVLAYFVTDKSAFYLLAAVAGSGLGAIQSASRAYMALVIPHGREGEFFGFYALCGKSAAVMGPVVFGAVSALSSGNQRLSVLSVLLFLVAGGILLLRAPAPRASAATAG